MNEHLRERIPAFLYYFIIVTAACLYTLFDLMTFTLYFTYWLPAIVLVIPPIMLYLHEPNRFRAIILGLLLIWLVAVPHIRWDHYKSFFIDARRLHPGMELAKARSIMKPYYFYTDTKNPKVTRFKPYEGGGSQCIVHTGDNKITSVKILVD